MHRAVKRTCQDHTSVGGRTTNQAQKPAGSRTGFPSCALLELDNSLLGGSYPGEWSVRNILGLYPLNAIAPPRLIVRSKNA